MTAVKLSLPLVIHLVVIFSGESILPIWVCPYPFLKLFLELILLIPRRLGRRHIDAGYPLIVSKSHGWNLMI